MHALSITWHAAFNSAFNWMANIWIVYFRVSLVFSIYSLNCGPWFVPDHFCFKSCETPFKSIFCLNYSCNKKIHSLLNIDDTITFIEEVFKFWKIVIWASDHPVVMCTSYQHLCRLHSTMPSIEHQTSEACNQELLLKYLVHIWDWMVADPKISSFYLSINVISISLSFIVLDLCPIILVQKFWNTHTHTHTHFLSLSLSIYIYIYI